MEREMWSARATNWAEVQEGTVLPLYREVLTKTGIGSGTSFLVVGCSAWRLCQMVTKVTRVAARPAMTDIPKNRMTDGEHRRDGGRHRR
jgi:hypothetical protein